MAETCVWQSTGPKVMPCLQQSAAHTARAGVRSGQLGCGLLAPQCMMVSRSRPLQRVTTAHITGISTPHYTVHYPLADGDSVRAQESYSRSSSFVTLKSYRVL